MGLPANDRRPAITFTRVGLTWPDGVTALRDLDLTIPPGRTALVGANGSGKSTLLRLASGRIAPSTGHVRVDGEVGYLPQDLTLDVGQPVEDLLGIGRTRRALRAIEAGSTDPAHYDAVGDDWDIELRVRGLLERLGLPGELLESSVGEVSGGEATRLGLVALLLRRPDALLLDEPTNNLDRPARERVHELVATWPRTLVVISHDRELLEHVERIGEVRSPHAVPTSVAWYGGGWSAYVEQVAIEQEAAERAVDAARGEVRRQRRGRIEAEQRLAQRRRAGRRDARNSSKAERDFKQNRAEKSAASFRDVHAERLDAAQQRLGEAELGLREEAPVRLDLPGSVVHRGRRVLTTTDLVLRTGRAVALELVGPERVAVLGRNGAGKSTLLHTVSGLLSPGAGLVEAHVPLALLPQRLDVLDDALSVADNVHERHPDVERTEVRAGLARLGLRGRSADKPAGVLSGGERFRATLATVLLARPVPQLLLLDEPTNNLDLSSYQALVAALRGYHGALLVASHDPAFLEDIGVERELDLDAAAE